jgi:hypothetical protein
MVCYSIGIGNEEDEMRKPGQRGQSGNVTVTQMSGQEVEVVIHTPGQPTRIEVYSDEEWDNLIWAAALMRGREL